MSARVLTSNGVWGGLGHRPQIIHSLPVARAPSFQVAGIISGTGGQFTHAQLFNPVGSGVEVLLLGVGITTGGPGSLIIGWSDVEMGTAPFTVYSTHASVTAAAPLAVMRSDTNVSSSAFGQAPVGGFIKKSVNGSRLLNEIDMFYGVEALTIPEGVGVLLTSLSVGTSLHCTFRWREIAA